MLLVLFEFISKFLDPASMVLEIIALEPIQRYLTVDVN